MTELDMTRLRAALADDYAELRYAPEIASTNTALMEATDVVDGTVLLTDSQTAGKGRLGRVWVAPPHTQVTFSVLLLPTSLEHLGTLPLAAGLAVTDAIPGTVLKWPNDVLLEGKKLCGILAEAGPVGEAQLSELFKAGELNKAELNKTELNKAEVAKAQFGAAPSARVVLGMGINVSLAEDELPVPTATSLQLEGRDTDRTELAIAVLQRLRVRIAQWQNQDPQLMADYRAVCSSIGMDVRLEAPTGNIVGVVDGVGEDGRISVNGEYYSAGDVIHLRPAH